MRLVGPRDRQSDGFGAGCEQQPVEGDLAAVGERDLAGARIDACDLCRKAQIDGVLGIEAVGTQRHPILRRGAREVVLGEVWPINRGRIVIAQHDNASLVLRTPQSLGRREPGCPAANDDDLLRRAPGGAARTFGSNAARCSRTKILPPCLLDRPARERAQGRARKASPLRRSKHA